MLNQGHPEHPDREQRDPGESPLQAVLDEFTAACIEGAVPDVTTFCRAHPECGPELQERLEEIRFVVEARHERRSDDHPEAIGPYRILEVLGEGGMGTVYLAEQREPVRRRVALKVVKLGMDSRAVVKRFELERQALAVMNHENIARVFDCGTTERGQPYFALEYVSGTPLTEYCDRHSLSIEARVRLFRQLCDGVQHAHQKGVIHRDLKPGNVLVTEEGGVPIPKIIDFGLARATNHMLLRGTMHTDQGRVLGTPEYMSPEQADPSVSDIDTRTDIYSLGVMLYEVLVGSLPFSAEQARRPGLLEMQRREDEPPRPSSRLCVLGEAEHSVASKRGTTPAALRRALRSDLDWVVLKAMEKDRSRRYESASGLAMDLERYLTHDPLVAGPPSAGYRLRKLMRRYRTQMAAGMLVLLTAVTGAVIAIVYAERANRSADQLRAKVAEFDQLALVVHLRSARARASELFPAWPERIPALTAWLEDDVARIRQQVPGASATMHSLSVRHDADLGESDRFLREALREVLQEIDEFERREVVEVRQRLFWAERVAWLTVDRHRHRWEQARAAIAGSERYRDRPIDLMPQIGLVPIGENPVTGLWEFYHLRSAWDPTSAADPTELPIPRHRDDGTIAMGSDTGIVFALLPGGAFAMGAQSVDPAATGYDALAFPDEQPVREIELAPFFLARHEITKAQWQRLSSGGDVASDRFWAPREDRPAPIGPVHPVDMVEWTQCDAVLGHHALELPTEAQWEYGCRAGGKTPWWSGADASSLAGRANLLDLTAERLYPKWGDPVGAFDDGYAFTAPVGMFGANPFGLFDIHGNVWEWCRDGYDDYAVSPRGGDGLRDAADTAGRTVRGGSYLVPATYARVSYRHRFAPNFRNDRVGARASRPLRQ